MVIFDDDLDAEEMALKIKRLRQEKYNKNTLKNARLRLDGKGEREFRKRLLTCLRKELKGAERKVIKNLRFRNSKNDVLVQLADMIAGSVNRSFSSKKDAKAYFDIIKKKVEEIWIPKIFPQ